MNKESNRPVVSVITPAYNAEAFLAETIESVRAQSFQNWEMIIADDGSTDDTATIAEKYAALDSRIKLQRSPQNTGRPACARNLALSVSRGRFIAFLDADDLWHPEKLSNQLKAMRNARSAWCISQGEVITETGETTGLKVRPKQWRPQLNPQQQLIREGSYPLFTVIARRKLLLAAAGSESLDSLFDEDPRLKAVEDWDLCIRLARFAKPIYFPEPQGYYREHQGGISKAAEQNYERVSALLDKHEGRGASPESIAVARTLALSKRALSRMLSDSQKPWRADLILTSVRKPDLRNLFMLGISVLPRELAKRAYRLGLSIQKR